MKVYENNGLTFNEYGNGEFLSVSAASKSIQIADIPSKFMGIPVTHVSENGFSGCSRLISVTIPESITDIGLDAFEGCKAIREVCVESIGVWCDITFWNSQASPIFCGERAELYVSGERVTELTVPYGITEIKPYSFKGFSSLKRVAMPDGIARIGHGAFFGCRSLESIDLPDSITYVGEEAFLDCTTITRISLPSNTPIIRQLTFCGCTSLSDISLPVVLESIGHRAFYGCLSLKNILLPEGLINIGNEAFAGCTSLDCMSIPSSVETIGINAFSKQ